MWQQRVQDELEPGESLVWSAQPLTSPGRAALGAFWLVLTAVGHYSWLSFQERQRQFDDDFDKNFQGEFFRESRERRRKDAEAARAFDVEPIVTGLSGVIGLAILLSPLWAVLSRKRRQARSCYALTTRRALVWEPAADGGGVCLRAYEPQRLVGALERVERDDGSGDLVFETYTYTYQVNVASVGNPPVWEPRQGTGQRGFLNVAHVRQVERLLRQTLLQA
jgi:hypothetical protein